MNRTLSAVRTHGRHAGRGRLTGRKSLATLGVLVVAVFGCAETGPSTSSQSGEAGAAPTQHEVTAFVDVNVVPMDRERVLEHQTVIVREGRIATIGPEGETEVLPEARQIDGRGKYLMPGLAEMHGHLPSSDVQEDVAENMMFLYVANGVTTVRGMQGDPSQNVLRARINRGEIIGPQLYLAGPPMSGSRVTAVEDAERLVREYKEAGFDLVKVSEDLTPEVYDAITSTAKDVGMPVVGHVSNLVGLGHVLEAGQSTIDHLDGYIEALVPEVSQTGEPLGLLGVGQLLDRIDEAEIPTVVEATRQAGVGVVPTMVLFETIFFGNQSVDEIRQERPEVMYMPPEQVQAWARAVEERRQDSDPERDQRVAELRRKILKALHDGGVQVLFGTDSPQVFSVPGFSIHREMELWVASGMKPFDVLRTGTRNVAEHFDAADDFGTVAEGQRADLMLVSGNPLEDVANVARREGVMVHGRWIAEQEIQERLAQVASSYASE